MNRPPDMSQLLKHAQQVQEQVMAMEEDLASRTYEGTAGGGAIRVVVAGASRIASVEIRGDALDDSQMLGDLIVVAANQALEAAAADAREVMGSLTGGMNLGGLLG
jgi:nucleoid-associated protein EbfC